MRLRIIFTNTEVACMFDTPFRSWYHILRLARYVCSWYFPSQHDSCNLPSDTAMIQVRSVLSQPVCNTAADAKAAAEGHVRITSRQLIFSWKLCHSDPEHNRNRPEGNSCRSVHKQVRAIESRAKRVGFYSSIRKVNTSHI